MRGSIVIITCLMIFSTFQAKAQHVQHDIIILAQDDDAAREAAQRELDESLRRDAEQSRQDCERRRDDSLKGCLSGETTIVLNCQSTCNSISDAAQHNDCKRDCSNTEASQKNRCYNEHMTVICN